LKKVDYSVALDREYYKCDVIFFLSQKFIPIERFVFEIGNPEELSATGRLGMACQKLFRIPALSCTCNPVI